MFANVVPTHSRERLPRSRDQRDVHGHGGREHDHGADAGIAVVDYSMAETDGNDIRGVRLGPEAPRAGIRSIYYAEVRLGRDRIDVPDATVATFERRSTR